MKKFKKNLIFIIFLILNSYSQYSLAFQQKLTNINSFPTIDIGTNTNEIKTVFGVDGITNNYDFFMMLMDKSYGQVSVNLYKKFFWNFLSIEIENYKVSSFIYGFGESSMDFEDKATVRSQTNYEQKLPLVLKYLYNKYGTNYKIKKVRKSSYDDKQNLIDPMIYWEQSDGRIYGFHYTRLSKISLNHLPIYYYVAFKNKRKFDGYTKINGLPDGYVEVNLATLTAEHKALEQQYGLLD